MTHQDPNQELTPAMKEMVEEFYKQPVKDTFGYDRMEKEQEKWFLNEVKGIEPFLVQAMQKVREEAIKECVQIVTKDVERYHKTCTIKMFDNGKFWEAKEIQEALRSLINNKE